MSEMPEDDKHWTLDRKVPVAIVVTIALQTCGIVWWASGLDHRVTALETHRLATASQPDRLTRLEVSLDHIRQSLERVERAIIRKERTE
jgi:hypothetical protein